MTDGKTNDKVTLTAGDLHVAIDRLVGSLGVAECGVMLWKFDKATRERIANRMLAVLGQTPVDEP